MNKKYDYLDGVRFSIGPTERQYKTYWFEKSDERNMIKICWIDNFNEKQHTTYSIKNVLDNIKTDVWFINKTDLRKAKIKQLKNG